MLTLNQYLICMFGFICWKYAQKPLQCMDGMIRLVNKWYLFDMYLFAKESSKLWWQGHVWWHWELCVVSQVRELHVKLREFSDPMAMEVGMQRPLICLKTFLGSEMCFSFVLLHYLVMTSFRGSKDRVLVHTMLFLIHRCRCECNWRC